jgi:hypothetical protein
MERCNQNEKSDGYALPLAAGLEMSEMIPYILETW